MKSKLKYIIPFLLGGVLLLSCEDKESNYAAMTKDYDAGNTTYYVQFLNATAAYQTSFTADGTPTNVDTKISVALLGAPQSSDVSIPLEIDGTSTLASNMYTLSANSITIAAGETSGSVDLTVIASEMPDCDPLSLVVNLNAGANNATQGTVLNYGFKKNSALGDLNDWTGSWAGTDTEGFETAVVTAYDADVFTIDGLNVGWMTGWWGEEITEQIPLEASMNGDGTITIARQYYMTTLYAGAPYRYECEGSGTWDGCSKGMIITYNMYYEGDTEPAYTNFPVTETITLK